LFMDRLDQVLQRVKREKVVAAVIFIDLDHFKDVNDSLGHTMGDRVLVEAAKRLKACVRNSDTVARLGGDEFVILLSATARDLDASVVAERILSAFAQPFSIDNHEAYVTASIGIAVAPHDSMDAQVLLKNADAAMYQSKDLSRNTYHYFTMRMEDEARQRMRIKANLRHALTEQQFFLVYQPILDMATEKIIGAEALIRWRDPQTGLMAPDQFLPLAEEIHLMGAIGDWVLEEALRQTRIWQSRWDPNFMMFINIAVQQVNDPSFAVNFEGLIRRAGVESRTITLEIVERFMLSATDVTQANIRRVHELGAHWAVDDFGTGYSALGYFTAFPIKTLKVDRQFLQDMRKDSLKESLYQAIMNLSQLLQLKTVSEGIETKDHLEYVRQLKADWGQGFLFSRPLEPVAFEAYYQELVESGLWNR